MPKLGRFFFTCMCILQAICVGGAELPGAHFFGLTEFAWRLARLQSFETAYRGAQACTEPG